MISETDGRDEHDGAADSGMLIISDHIFMSDTVSPSVLSVITIFLRLVLLV